MRGYSIRDKIYDSELKMAFQKFMNKKDFHPGSLRNIKMVGRRVVLVSSALRCVCIGVKVWEAEQKEQAAERREKEMKELYEKEQERYRTRHGSTLDYSYNSLVCNPL